MSDQPNRKRSVSISGHRTSFSLEDRFWTCLKRMAVERGIPLAALVAEIDAERAETSNLSSMIRLRVLDWALSHREQGLHD